MTTTIATRVEPGSRFDLSQNDPAMLALHKAGATWALPFVLMERLVQSDTPYSEHARALRSEVVRVAGAGFD